MSSQERLQGIFGSGSGWPKSEMTLEENIASLKTNVLVLFTLTQVILRIINVSLLLVVD